MEGGVLTLIRSIVHGASAEVAAVWLEDRRVAPPAVNTGDVSRHMSPALPVAYAGGGAGALSPDRARSALEGLKHTVN